MLAIPTLTALILGGLRVSDELSRANQFKQTATQVDLASKVTDVVQLLQGERTEAIAKIINPNDPRVQGALTNQMAQVDRAVDALRAETSRFEGENPDSAQRYEQGLQGLDALTALRASVNTPPYPELAAFTAYSSILHSLVQLGREVTSSVPDHELMRQGTILQAISEAKEAMVGEDAALEIAALRNSFSNVLLDDIRAAQYQTVAALDLFRSYATPGELQSFTDTVSGTEVDGRARLAATALAHAAAGSAPNISQAELVANSAVNLEKLRSVETNLLGELRTRSNELADQASAAAWRDIFIVLGALAVALLLSALVAQMLLKPLRVLRRSALHIAHTQLPEAVHKILQDPDPVAASKSAVEPVPVTTREEIGEVARSFDVVHEQAIKMAAEQALLRENVNGIFVNLSRRSQRLVERQLGVIDRLEADEQDPDHLASLFELDHLATRLRRNGESLLVLSGAGLAKSVPKPVSAADVIGAAVSEIEQYARVEVGVIPDVAVRGLTVHDLVHLLAELLDNATYFSEPETKVSVRAVVTRRHALAVQITDRGVGMSEEKIAEANQRLAEPPDLDVSVTRRMGLYVVARLARRHGIEVRLRENEDIEGGVIARIVVPAELLGPVSEPAPPPPPSAAEISWPSAADGEPEPMPEVPAQRPRPPSTAERSAAGGLQPLAQPMTLDDLVAGSSKAAYLSQGRSSSSAPHTANGTANGAGTFSAPELPKREPALAPEQPAAPEPAELSTLSALAEDDAPTRRLPIYQSVVSRWFAAEAENAIEADLTESQGAVDGIEPEATAMAQETADVTPEPEAAAESEPEPEVAATAGAPGKDDWSSAADAGWRAAQALLDSKPEVITTAGLPKRVPNAYLVPGSISSGEPDSFVDRTTGQPGRSAIARSATAARDRMVSFQRGFTSGRHAVREGKADNGVTVNGGESSSPSGRSKE
ncbi:sensor histidine kinase [Amycolatopsis taiwanensis]|uniref:sensor histidine kinase n=1 Tax=Amycolatopsis taiwanensis TaxID=342230 RepID=UPI0025553F34|nr:nitrate- and nitrite sensing domain-containing protein [Amycolatopsis taiwanensis]